MKYLKNQKKMGDLLNQVSAKSQDLPKNEENFSFLNVLGTLRRMMRAYRQGDYKAIPRRSLTLIIAALLYFVSPIDFLPDFLPLLGFTDDIALIIFVYNSIRSDVEKFRHWESQQSSPLTEMQ